MRSLGLARKYQRNEVLQMTLAEHEGWKRYWLKAARLHVAKREWLRASECYRSAAFHHHILKTLRSRKR
jgi:hypothetical protein